VSEDYESRIDTPVWDWPVRVGHWVIVSLVATVLATGLTGGESVMVWHMRTGETLLALVLFRILWGFAGSRNARFATFVRGPRAALRYLRSFRLPSREAYATHNPLGGWMVIALLVALLVQCCLGLFANDEVLVEGPLAKFVTQDMSDALSALHRRGWWVVAGLASVHIVAALWYFVALDDNLIYSMVSGTKKLPAAVADASAASASTARALLLLALCALAVWWTVSRL
jgi:cytochrome b